MYDYRQLSLFWQSIRPIQGSTKFAVQFNGQTIIPQDFDFVQKNGVAYIYDTRNDKLYDQYLNYYQNGTYFNSDGTPKMQVQNDNVIDVDPNNIYKHTPQDGIEYFDSEGNSLGYKNNSKHEVIDELDDIEKAIKETNYFTEAEFSSKKDVIKERFLRVANTEESQQLLLDYMTNPQKDINIDDIARKNASAHARDKVSHGLLAFDNLWSANDNKGMSEIDMVKRNLENITSNGNIELALSEDAYKLGSIGVTGTADITGYFPQDTSSVSENGLRKSKQYGNAVLENIFDLEDGGFFQSYSEYYGKKFNIESLWVRDDFFKQNQDEIVSLLQKHNIEYVDLVHGTNNSYGPQYTRKSLNFDRISTKDLIEQLEKGKEETIITIDNNNTGVKTETTSTKDTNIPDSSTNQNNAESIKQEEPINRPDKPKSDFVPTDAEYSKYVFEEYQKGNTDVMSIEEYYRNKHTPEEQSIIDEINNRPQQSEPRPEQNVESTPKTSNSTPDVESKLDTAISKSQPETKFKSGHTAKRGPKVKSSNITKEQVKKATKKTTQEVGMKMKNLANNATEAISEGINWGKVGKIGAVVGVAALVGFGIHKHNEKEKENRKYGPDRLTGATRKSEFWNQSYTAQMAKDISTYQYGKRMTGFVQG